MSLKVWLPLNGTLENKGTTDITASNYGATVDNNGKIGKCYKFNPDNSSSGQNYIKLNAKSSDIFQSGQSFSLSCFFKLTGDLYSNGCGLIACSQYRTTGFGLMISQRKICIQLCFGDSELEWKPTISSFDNDIWYHVCFTYNEIGKKLALYVDGELVAATTETRDWQVNTSYTISIGLGTQGGWGYTIPGFMNDVRIYDHALSSVEVKEISRGLIIHYPLNHIFTKNLITFDLTDDNYTITNYGNRTPGTILNKVYHADGYQSETSADTSFGILSNNYITLKSNYDYYLSFYCKSKSSNDLYFGTSGQAYTGLKDDSNNYFRPESNFSLGLEYSGYVILKVRTGTSTQYKINLGFDGPNIYGIGSFIEFSNILLSETKPDLYSSCLENTITDCSGYNNNGTIIGNLTLSDDSIRYSNSITFDKTSYIQRTSPSSEVKSISLWAKWSSIPSGQSIIFVDYKSRIGLGLYSGGILCSTAGVSTKAFSKSGIVANTWYHFVIINPGDSPSNTTRDLYINGVKQALSSSSSYWTYSLDYLQLGKRSTSSDGFSGEISDFRMYTIALSEDDVRQLYNVSGKIDDKNNVHGFELIENNKKSIEKTGNINFNFEERDTNVFIYKQVNPNLLQGTVINSLRFERTSGMSTEFGKRFTPISQLQVDTYYTFSAMIRGNANMNIYTINTGGNQAFTYVNKEDLDEKEFKLFSLTFRVTGNRVIQEIYLCSRYGEANTLVGDWYEIQENSIKLEEGEMCTPWVPAQTDNYYRSYDNMLTAKQFIEI